MENWSLHFSLSFDETKFGQYNTWVMYMEQDGILVCENEWKTGACVFLCPLTKPNLVSIIHGSCIWSRMLSLFVKMSGKLELAFFFVLR